MQAVKLLSAQPKREPLIDPTCLGLRIQLAERSFEKFRLFVGSSTASPSSPCIERVNRD